jgi:glucosamine--fructose-6-phosphate aminotransferase (isomerizing)
MCGIFGLIFKPNTALSSKSVIAILTKIAVLSESRGKDSSGIAFRNEIERTIHLIKGDIPIRKLLQSGKFKYQLRNSVEAYEKGYGFSAFGHARLVTNGSQLHEVNNQPVLKDAMIVIHNGIIVNVDKLWQEHRELKREYLIDTEIIPALIRKELNSDNSLINSCNYAFSQIEGTYSIAAMFQDTDQFVLATNNGSLYYVTDNSGYIVFASEKYILEKLKSNTYFIGSDHKRTIQQMLPDQGIIINLSTLKINHFDRTSTDRILDNQTLLQPYHLEKHLLENKSSKNEVVIDPAVFINRLKEGHLFNLLEKNTESIRKLSRCTKCLLPETFPFIEYDEKGVCNYCRNYSLKMQFNGLDKLKELVGPYRNKDGASDCIVPFSGGRDSTYSLHVIKRELGLNPIAFTYDWGMVTDLARRNIARVCGKLGVENIIVSADIRWKRENIRKNIVAWLKSPDLGMIPLFMAGDKFFFYYCNQVKKQTGIDLNIWGINPLENTEFKTGFAGLFPVFDKNRIYSLSNQNQLKLFKYVAGNIFKSPGYINQSIFDSLGSFAVRYIAPKKDYYHLFDYYKWDEEEINDLIKYEYNWETAIDTKSTWRIGDGTASFYNYIYHTVAGFSENDTFRSNQIREGMLDRETALKLTEYDNIPRYETLRWYLEIIGLDFGEVINVVNAIPKLYKI